MGLRRPKVSTPTRVDLPLGEVSRSRPHVDGRSPLLPLSRQPLLSQRERAQCEARRGAFDLVHGGDVAEDIGLGSAQLLQVVELAEMDALIDQKITMHGNGRAWRV